MELDRRAFLWRISKKVQSFNIGFRIKSECSSALPCAFKSTGSVQGRRVNQKPDYQHHHKRVSITRSPASYRSKNLLKNLRSLHS